jgi:hypothetical protein
MRRQPGNSDCAVRAIVDRLPVRVSKALLPNIAALIGVNFAAVAVGLLNQ